MLNQYLKTSIASTRGLYFINLFPFKNHSLSLCCSNAKIFGYVRSPIEPISHVRTYMLSASSSYHLVPFLGTPCLNLVKLSQPLNALAAFRVSVRHFCSETVTVDQNFDCDGRSGIEDESLESDVDKFCETNDFVSVSLPKDSPLFGFSKRNTEREMSSSTRKKVQKKCKIRGYTLELDAVDEILSFESEFNNDSALDDPVDILLDLLVTQPIKDKETVHRIATRILGADAAINETPDGDGDDVIRASDLLIVDAFKVPKFRYDPIKKVFYKHTGSLPMHGDAFSKAALYKDRFLLLSQMLSRHKDFSKPAFDSELSDFGRCEISPIQSLIGQTGRRWVMGLISQLEDGHFYLEDLSASVEINLSNAKITAGFFVENTIVVAEGEMLLEGVFQVFNCGFPPLEGRDKSLQFLAGHDSFGSGTLTEQETLRLAKLEREAVNGNVVILSDIWLDNEEAMGKLERVLDAFENEDFVPCVFVLMGNFCSHPCNLGFHSFSNLRSQFGKLGQMIAAHPRLKEGSCFLFIPGPDDAGPSTVLPRPSLPKYLREELQNHIPNAIFSSNPCRMKFCSQEVVFFRQDLLYRMRRSCLMPPSTEETTDDFEHLVATITHQCHLCPLPLIVQPIIWNYDHSLYLYPTPHTIVLGDRSEQKAFKYTGITCFNPGSFSSDGAFVVYRPDNQEVELSSL